MQYEYQTTLGVILEPGEMLTEVARRLHSSLNDAVKDAGSVMAFRVGEDNEANELLVAIRFLEGVRAEFVEDTASEILDEALRVFEDTSSQGEARHMSEETVRLQSVFA